MGLAESTTDIANLALSNLGVGSEISDLLTDQSQAGKVCRRFYDTSLVSTLRDYDWGFARKIVQLAKVSDFRPKQYPNEYNFSYQYPADAVIVRRLLSGNRSDTLQSAVPWRLEIGQNGKLILTDMDLPSAQTTTFVTAVELYPADFVMAHSHLLSALIAPRVTSGDPLNLGAKCFQKYMMFLSIAQKNDGIEAGQDLEHNSEFIRARD